MYNKIGSNMQKYFQMFLPMKIFKVNLFSLLLAHNLDGLSKNVDEPSKQSIRFLCYNTTFGLAWPNKQKRTVKDNHTIEELQQFFPRTIPIMTDKIATPRTIFNVMR